MSVEEYRRQVRARSFIRYLMGYVVRRRAWRAMQRRIARLRADGAEIANTVVIGTGMSFCGGKDLVIGEHCSLQSGLVDTRAPVIIRSHVIIGDAVRIIRGSHDVDSREWNLQLAGLEIFDYVWIATGAMILPGCKKIGEGAVIGAGAVVVDDVPPMAIMGGCPARILRQRKCVHDDIIVESLQGGDFLEYVKARRGERK